MNKKFDKFYKRSDLLEKRKDDRAHNELHIHMEKRNRLKVKKIVSEKGTRERNGEMDENDEGTEEGKERRE